MKSLFQLIPSHLTHSLNIYSHSTSPTLVPSISPPTTPTPSSNYPSLSPSTVYIISTIAGTGSGTYSGENGQATAADLNYPLGVRVDAAGNCLSSELCNSLTNYFITYLGNVYIGDSANNRVRKVTTSTGIITTFAGTGSTTYSGDNGPATSASLYHPTDVAVDSAGNSLFFAITLVRLTYLIPSN